MIEEKDEQYMRQALREARKAYDEEEVPIGAVIVQNNQIIARAHNQVELLKDPTAHAEILAITSACSYLGAKYLPEATLYVTVEPCLMCSGALQWSKIGRIVIGTGDSRYGAGRYVDKNPFHPKTKITSGILSEECASLVQDFFREKR